MGHFRCFEVSAGDFKRMPPQRIRKAWLFSLRKPCSNSIRSIYVSSMILSFAITISFYTFAQKISSYS